METSTDPVLKRILFCISSAYRKYPSKHLTKRFPGNIWCLRNCCSSIKVEYLRYKGENVPACAPNEDHPVNLSYLIKKKVREKSRECHNHKPQPFPDTKRKKSSMSAWMRPVRILVRLRDCAGWSESSLGTHVRRCIWRLGSFLIYSFQSKYEKYMWAYWRI